MRRIKTLVESSPRFSPTSIEPRARCVAPTSLLFLNGRWARDQKVTSENGWEVIPDLAVEVVSPTDRAIEVLAKVQEYLEAGVIRVWVVYPKVRQVHIFDEVTGSRGIIRNGTLDGEDLLPGFRLALAELFRDGAGD